jgi:Transposase IS66 family
MSNNAAERALRGVAVGRHNWTFAGSDDGGRRAADICTLIETAKLNEVDPQAWLVIEPLLSIHEQVCRQQNQFDNEVRRLARSDEVTRRLMTGLGVGVVTAHAVTPSTIGRAFFLPSALEPIWG